MFECILTDTNIPSADRSMLNIKYESTQQHVATDVEFAAIVEERSVDVFLDDEGLFGVVLSANFALNMEFYLLIITEDSDSVSSICILSWLYYPKSSLS